MGQVDSFEEIEGSSPRALRVRGANLLSAQDVVINSMVNNNFTVVSRSELIVRLPFALSSTPLTSLSVDVLLAEAAQNTRMYVRFGLTARPRMVSGTQKLVQSFLVQLLSDTGSCTFDRAAGTILRANLSGDVSESQRARLTTALSQSVQQVVSYLLRTQTSAGLPASERLLAAELARLDYVNGVPTATIRLSTYAGQVVFLPFAL